MLLGCRFRKMRRLIVELKFHVTKLNLSTNTHKTNTYNICLSVVVFYNMCSLVCTAFQCVHVCTTAQHYTHSLQPHSTGFSTSCVTDVPLSHSKVSRRRRILRGAQQEAAPTPCTMSVWQRPRHSTQEKGFDVWQRTVPRCSRW